MLPLRTFGDVDLSEDPNTAQRYRFEHLTLSPVLKEKDMYFSSNDPAPGDRVPKFDLPTVDGGRFRSSDLAKTGPALLIFGSSTCPVTDNAAPGLNELYARFGDRLRFVMVNVREAHPGSAFPQPKTIGAKMAHAERLRHIYGLEFEVAVDDVDGTLHRSLSPKPNSAYVLRADGTIFFRAQWANDTKALAAALDAIVAGESPRPSQSGGVLKATVRMLRNIAPVLDRAGRGAWADMWRVAPPLAGIAFTLKALHVRAAGPAAKCVTRSSKKDEKAEQYGGCHARFAFQPACEPRKGSLNKMWNLGLFVGLALFGWLRILGHVTDPPLSEHAIHQIVGEPAGVSRVVDEPQGLKVVTWNIQGGAEFDRILTTLQSLSPDIILLQEVDVFCRRSGWRDVAKDLADALGMNWMRAGEFQEIGESRRGVPALTGQAVLSKYPIEDSAAIPFAAQARLRWRLSPLQPRRGGRMVLRFRTAGILVYNSHIESGGNDKLRRSQVEEILADQAREAHDEAPVVIAGDFNNSPAIRSSMFGPLTAAAFADALIGNEVRRTSIHHKHPIDWIFVKNLKARSSRVAEVDHVSDHYPVLAMLATTP